MRKLFLLGFLLICGCSKPTQVEMQEEYLDKFPNGTRILNVDRNGSGPFHDDWVEVEMRRNGTYYRILVHRYEYGQDSTESMIILEQHPEQAEK